MRGLFISGTVEEVQIILEELIRRYGHITVNEYLDQMNMEVVTLV